MASDDLRARIASVLAGHEPVPGMWDCTCGVRTYDFAQHRADAVLAVVQPDLDRERSERDEALERSRRLLERSIDKTVTRKKAEAERDRCRLAWQSARQRAQAYGEGIVRLCDDRDSYKGWMLEQAERASRAEQELSTVRAALGMLTARSDRCPQCRCHDCNGLLAQHTETGCGCDECVAYPEYACRAFALPERINLIAQQLGLLLSVHLGPKQQQRCLAVAHAAHHALHIYDYPEETPS